MGRPGVGTRDRATGEEAAVRPSAAPERARGPAAAGIPCLLAWLVPGAGHVYLGQRLKGLAFLVIVLCTFSIGLLLDGRTYLVDPSHPLTYLATFANVALGPLDLLQREATYQELVWHLPAGPGKELLLERMRRRIRSPYNEFGTTFLLTAGLMNILLILDVFDGVMGRKGSLPGTPAP